MQDRVTAVTIDTVHGSVARLSHDRDVLDNRRVETLSNRSHEEATMPDVMPSTTWFISRRVGLPLATAVTALDELVEHRRRDLRGAAVPLSDALDVWPAVALPGTARCLDARLRLGGLARPLRVEIELSPWSRAESEIGIRPTRRPRPRDAERYWAGASDALAALRATLPSFASAPSPVLARWPEAS